MKPPKSDKYSHHGAPPPKKHKVAKIPCECCCTIKGLAIACGVWDVLDCIFWFINFIYSIVYIALFDGHTIYHLHIKYIAPLFFLSNVPRVVLFFVMWSKGFAR